MEIFDEYGFEFLLRYAHVISGITWIGLLYYFNFVQVPAFAAFEAPARNEALAKLAPRALWWFRWGAVSTFLFGLFLFVSQEQYEGDYMKTPGGMAILTGILFALIMFYNVWMVIWPAQQKVIANAEGVLAGREADPAAAAAARKGACASRTNTLLSIPMLFFMVATSHFAGLYAPAEGGTRAVWWLLVVAIAIVAEGIALRAPAAGKPEAWHIDQHKNTLIAGFGLLIVMYVVWELLLG
jgi:uncharacterized membrane protein